MMRAAIRSKGERWPRQVGFGLHGRQTIGLFGGSFDPFHEGHAHVARLALQRLGLSRLVFVPARGNPLKQGPSAFAGRLARLQREARGSRLGVSALERSLGLSYTIDWARRLMARRPTSRFVLVLGGDNWANFHRWRNWKGLAALFPIAVIARPGEHARVSALAKARLSRAGRYFRAQRLDDDQGRLLARGPAPCWIWLSGPLNAASSTALRAQNSGQEHGRAQG
jgi:nicotinate-nucleotide adenylyltransferase